MNNCKACNDLYNPLERREVLAKTNLQLQKGELEYCLTCANELFRGVIPCGNVKLYSGSVHHGQEMHKEINE